MFRDRFSGKRVLVTGHTGFKGSWLTSWLVELGAKVCGYSLAPSGQQALYEQLHLRDRLEHEVVGDVRDGSMLSGAIHGYQPDFIFHLAAQPLVRASYSKPKETFETNVMGTVHLLDALIGYDNPCSVVVVTTDKCYENKEWLYSYREEDPLGGYDPYSASKGCAEIVAAAYRQSFFSTIESNSTDAGRRIPGVRVATARAGNVIGGGDWAQDRIVPDVMRCVYEGRSVPVRNKISTRPWQHVLEPLSGYLWLAAQISDPTIANVPVGSLCSAFNFGPQLEGNRTVAELVDCLLKRIGGSWKDVSDPQQPHEASKLNLAIDKAFHLLDWKPTWGFDVCVAQTADWYESVQNGLDPIEATDRCLKSYFQDAIECNQAWVRAN